LDLSKFGRSHFEEFESYGSLDIESLPRCGNLASRFVGVLVHEFGSGTDDVAFSDFARRSRLLGSNPGFPRLSPAECEIVRHSQPSLSDSVQDDQGHRPGRPMNFGTGRSPIDHVFGDLIISSGDRMDRILFPWDANLQT
jgi:hypothetical protein